MLKSKASKKSQKSIDLTCPPTLKSFLYSLIPSFEKKPKTWDNSSDSWSNLGIAIVYSEHMQRGNTMYTYKCCLKIYIFIDHICMSMDATQGR